MRMVDVIVVGSGIIGLSCAVALAEAGAQVMLCEQTAHCGSGASGTPTGMLLPPIGRMAPTMLGQLCHAGAACYAGWCQQLAEHSGIDPEYRALPVLRLCQGPPARLHAGETWLPQAGLAELEPCVRASAWAGAIVRPAAARIHTRKLLLALRRRLRQCGGHWQQLQVQR